MVDKAYKSLTRRIAKIAVIVSVIAVTLSVGLLILLNSLSISFFSISGNSMYPTLKNKDSIILQQSDTLEKDLIVFFNRPHGWSYTEDFYDQPKVLVKRIVAVEDDVLEFDGDNFKINDEIIYSIKNNNYPCENPQENYKHTLDENELFVLGDNAQESFDSRRVFCDGQKNFLIDVSLVIDAGEVKLKF